MIGIIDCNNFYASCERNFDPKLNGLPVVVFSNNDGAIIARSEEAKAIGINMAIPIFEVKKLIEQHNIQSFSSNYTLYGDMSKRIKSIIRKFFYEVEDYSIDESFVSCNGFEHRDLYDYVKDARDKISHWSGVPVSIGIAQTKTLSKLANRIAKKHFRSVGLYVIDTEEKRLNALKKTNVSDVWGVGGRITAKLNAKGIFTAYDLSMVDPQWAKVNYSVVLQRTVYELQGLSCIPLELVQPEKQGIASQKSFGIYQTEFEPMAEALATYTARVAEKLRKQKCVAGGIEIWLGTNNFSKTDAQYFPKIHTVCDVPTDYTPYLIKRAVEGLKVIYREGYLYKRVGVMLTDIRDKSDGTLNLFSQESRKKEIEIINQVDRINRLNGRDTVRSAQQGFHNEWKMRQEHLSPRYTTRLSDIIEIK
jgi:DNA polymerase V